MIAFWVELASVFVAGLFSSGSPAVLRGVWAVHAFGNILARQLFPSTERSALLWYILFLAIVQWTIYVIAFLAIGSIAQRWKRSPPNKGAPAPNPASALQLQSTRPACRVAELGALTGRVREVG